MGDENSSDTFDGKKPSIKDIESAYDDLIKAYSLCLIKSNSIENEKREYIEEILLKRHIYKVLNPKSSLWICSSFLLPQTMRWCINRRVDYFVDNFLFLIISQKTRKIDQNIIEKIKIYCRDLNELSEQLKKPYLEAYLLYGISLLALPFILTLMKLLPNITITSISEQLGYIGISTDLVDQLSPVLYGIYIGTFIGIPLTISFLIILFVGGAIWNGIYIIKEEDVLEKEAKILHLIWKMYQED